jgi:chemotaxis protein MotA
MDKLSVIAVILAFVALLGGSILKGAGLMSLLNPAAFVIVIVGTSASIMLHTPMATFKHGWKMAKWVFRPPTHDAQGTIAKIIEWSGVARKQGLLALEGSVETERDPFVKKGLQMLVDGAEPDLIRNILELEMQTKEHFDQQGAKVFEGMGIYAPTLGIIGAVLGLIAVMKNLADPSSRVYRNHLRHRRGQSVLPAHGSKAEGAGGRGDPVPGNADRRPDRDRRRSQPAEH